MAKKSRRTKTKRRSKSAGAKKTPQRAKTAASQPQAPTDKAPVKTPAEHQPVTKPSVQRQPVMRSTPKAQDYVSRYDYVVPEIKRIGILTGAIVVILIVLVFILD